MNSSFQCRSCGGSHGELVLDLGLQPLANNLPRPEDLGKPEPKFPLRLAVCHHCWMLQITDLVPPTELFSEYLYFSSFSDALLRHSRAAVEQHIREFHLGPQTQVVEIASNDGYLLQYFQAAKVPALGIEPAANIAKVAAEKGIETRVDFFTLKLARELERVPSWLTGGADQALKNMTSGCRQLALMQLLMTELFEGSANAPKKMRPKPEAMIPMIAILKIMINEVDRALRAR